MSKKGKVIKIDLTPASIDKAIKAIEQYQKDLESFPEKVILASAERIKELAVQNLSILGYDAETQRGIVKGWQPIKKSSEGKGTTTYLLENTYNKAVFIEFGVGQTGANYSHEKAGEAGYEYDKNNHGSKGWTFYWEQGSALDLSPYSYKKIDRGAKIWIWTRGNPSSMFLFNAASDFIDSGEIEEIAKQILADMGF